MNIAQPVQHPKNLPAALRDGHERLSKMFNVVIIEMKYLLSKIAQNSFLENIFVMSTL